MNNKAHAAVVRRLMERYGASLASHNGFDLNVGELVVEVETTPRFLEAIEKLRLAPGRRFLAVTNREALQDAVTATAGTGIGVMDPWGEIVTEADADG
jgi:hypothetical protein